MRELAAKFGLHKSRRGFLGDSCQNAYWDDASTASRGITGLYNYASNQTFEAGIGGDDGVQDQGDLEASFKTAFADLRKVYQPGKYIVVMTSGLASHMYNERDTYTQTLDIERVKSIMSMITDMGANASWGGCWVTDQLYKTSTTPSATAQQQMMVLKASPSLINRHIVYPQQMMPMANKVYEADIQENMIFGDMLQVKKIDSTNNAIPITIAANLTTDTTGWIPDGTRIF